MFSWYTKENAAGDDPEVLARILGLGLDDKVSWRAALNPSCPPEVLAQVLERGVNNGVSQCAAENPNCPPEVLAHVLERGVDDGVSQNAAGNPNCPPYARLRWFHKAKGLFPPADKPGKPSEDIDVMA